MCRQTWGFVAPGPCRDVQPGPCIPPVSATLRGTLNLRTGQLVLDGTADYGAGVHVRGASASTPGGPASIAGEVMFNPQPDPPACAMGR